MNCHYCGQPITEHEPVKSEPTEDDFFTHNRFHYSCHKKWEDEKRWEREMQRLANLARRT